MTWMAFRARGTAQKLQTLLDRLNVDILFFQATNFAYTVALYVALPFLLHGLNLRPILANLFTSEAFSALAVLPFMVSPARLAMLIDQQGRGAYIKVSGLKTGAALAFSTIQIATTPKIGPPQAAMILLINLGNALIPHWELTRKGYFSYSAVLGFMRVLTLGFFLGFRAPWMLFLGHGLAYFVSGLAAMIRHMPPRGATGHLSFRSLYRELGPHAYLNGVRTLSLAAATYFLPRTVGTGMVFAIASIERLGRPIVTLSTPHFLRSQTRSPNKAANLRRHPLLLFVITGACFSLSLFCKTPVSMSVAWFSGILLDFWIAFSYLPLPSPVPQNYSQKAFWLPILVLTIALLLGKVPSPFWPLLYSCALLSTLSLVNSRPHTERPR